MNGVLGEVPRDGGDSKIDSTMAGMCAPAVGDEGAV